MCVWVKLLGGQDLSAPYRYDWMSTGKITGVRISSQSFWKVFEWFSNLEEDYPPQV